MIEHQGMASSGQNSLYSFIGRSVVLGAYLTLRLCNYKATSNSYTDLLDV